MEFSARKMVNMMKLVPERSNKEAFEHLKRNLLVWSAPAELIDGLSNHHIAVPFEKGAIIFSEGSTADIMAYVVSGYVKVSCPVGDGNRIAIRLAGPGEVIGYSDHVDLTGRRARMFESQAFSRCTVGLISRDHVVRMLRRLDIDSIMGIIECLNSFWSLRVRWFATLIGLPFINRLELVLSDLGLRAGVQDTRGTILIPELSHENLAEMIGSSRPMVSRLLSELIENGMVERRAKQYVLSHRWDFSPHLSLLLTTPSLEAVVCSSKGEDIRPIQLQARKFAAKGPTAMAFGGR
jgi:CRP/FNR family cyclic AMP-dependent transcriptional regulator